MNNTFENIKNELISRTQEINRTKKFIDEETAEFEKQIAQPKAFLDREERELRILKNKKVPVSINAYVEELCKTLGKSVSDVNVYIDFEEIYGNHSYDTLLEHYLTTDFLSEQEYDIDVDVEYFDNNLRHVSTFRFPITKSLYELPQLDGRPLKDHLIPVTQDNYSKFVVDDYRSIVLNTEIGEIYDAIIKPKTTLLEETPLARAVERTFDLLHENDKTL